MDLSLAEIRHLSYEPVATGWCSHQQCLTPSSARSTAITLLCPRQRHHHRVLVVEPAASDVPTLASQSLRQAVARRPCVCPTNMHTNASEGSTRVPRLMCTTVCLMCTTICLRALMSARLPMGAKIVNLQTGIHNMVGLRTNSSYTSAGMCLCVQVNNGACSSQANARLEARVCTTSLARECAQLQPMPAFTMDTTPPRSSSSNFALQTPAPPA